MQRRRAFYVRVGQIPRELVTALWLPTGPRRGQAGFISPSIRLRLQALTSSSITPALFLLSVCVNRPVIMHSVIRPLLLLPSLLLLAVLTLSWSCTVGAALLPSSPLAANIRIVNNKTLHYFNLSRPEGEREFYVYLYDGYTASSPSPLAVYYHGFGGGYQQGLQLNMTDAADRQQYILALPHGTPSTESGSIGWNGGRCCLFPNGSQPEVDDVAFTAAMLKLIQQSFSVDAERVYAMGWSNGGFMSERLGCEAAPLFAGIAADASAVIIGENNRTGLQLCDRHFRNNSINYLHYHGLNDPVVPWSAPLLDAAIRTQSQQQLQCLNNAEALLAACVAAAALSVSGLEAATTTSSCRQRWRTSVAGRGATAAVLAWSRPSTSRRRPTTRASSPSATSCGRTADTARRWSS